SEVIEKTDLSKEGRHLSLGSLLSLYAFAAKEQDLSALKGDLANLRNDVLHGKIVDWLNSWDQVLGRLVTYLPDIRKLLPHIEQVTGKRFTGTYEDLRDPAEQR